jgi:hypothetical protein
VRDRLLRDGYVILAVVFVALRLFAVKPWADSVDAYAYWTTRSGDFYAAAQTGQIGAYLYSPAFAQVIAPLVWLPVAAFMALWTAVNCAALWWLLGRFALPSLLFLPIPFEIISGNVHLLYAVAIVAGFRYPMSWALMVLTKVTPSVGILWFLIRREWQSLLLAIGVTAAIAIASFVLDRGAWEAWLRLLQGDLSGAGQASFQTVGWYLPISLLPRLLVSVGLVGFAALSDRRWLVPVAVVLALPVIWLNSLAILVAIVPLWQPSIPSAAGRFVAWRPAA